MSRRKQVIAVCPTRLYTTVEGNVTATYPTVCAISTRVLSRFPLFKAYVILQVIGPYLPTLSTTGSSMCILMLDSATRRVFLTRGMGRMLSSAGRTAFGGPLFREDVAKPWGLSENDNDKGGATVS